MSEHSIGYQFVHIELYSRQASRTLKRQSATNMAKEISRSPDSCPHVFTPKEPIQLFGHRPRDAVKLAEQRASEAKDAIGRKLRKDALILGSGVASYPARTTEIPWENPELQKWIELTHKYLQDKYGDKYVSLVAHSDEEFWHVHYILLPDIDEMNRLDVSSIHQGIKARNSVRKGSAKEKMRAYQAAMRDFQSEYYDQVGKLCGLTRDGPKRRRLTRKEWVNEKKAAKRLASANQRIESAFLLVRKIYDELSVRDRQLKAKERTIVESLKNLSRNVNNLKSISQCLKQYKNNKLEMR